MTLSEMISNFEKNYSQVINSEKDGDKELNVVYSGGEVKWGEPVPALYISESLAIKSWLSCAPSASPWCADLYSLEWVLKPELLKFQITMADMKQRHRVVNDRYTVKSQFKVKRISDV